MLRNISSFLVPFLLCLAVTLSGCSGSSQSGTAPTIPDTVQPSTTDAGFESLGLEFPPPSVLAGHVTSADDDWLQPGSNHLTEMPYANVQVEDSSLWFLPYTDDGGGQSSTAYAYYAFDVVNWPLWTDLKFVWHEDTPSSLCWIGLANWENDEWEWTTMPASGKVRLSDLGEYIGHDHPLTFSVVMSGSRNYLLDWIRLGENTPPEADLTVSPDSGENPLAVTLDASGSIDSDGNIIRYDWDFDGDGVIDSRSYTRSSVDFTYRNPGVYTAIVTVIDDAWDTDTAEAGVTVTANDNIPPVAQINAVPTGGDPPLMVNFDASASHDSDGEIVRWDWDFDGDGAIDFRSHTTPLASFEYTVEGSFNATVTVYDDCGDHDSASQMINIPLIPNEPPFADFTAVPQHGAPPLTVSFDASTSYDSDGEIGRWDWDFDGDDVVDYTDYGQPFASHEYTAAGEYPATLTVTDDDGASASTTRLIDVGITPNQPPVAVLEASRTGGRAPLTVNFDAAGSHDNDGRIIRYDWDYDGDGADDGSTVSPASSHEYTVDGTYHATVTVVDDDGATASDTIRINVGYWAHTWGGEMNEKVNHVVEDNDGNVYACGAIGEGIDSDGLLLKFTTGGEFQWARAWDTGLSEFLSNLVVDSAGNVWVCGGFSQSTDYYVTYDSALLCFSPTGELLSQTAWGLLYNDRPTYLLQDAEGYLYLLGTTRHPESDTQSVVILKYDQSGNLMAAKAWADSPCQVPESAYIDHNGYITILSFGEHGFNVIKLDSAFNLYWGKSYYLPGFRIHMTGISELPSGEMFLGGTYFETMGESNHLGCKLNPDGTPSWAIQVGGPCIENTGDSSVLGNCLYISGYSEGTRPYYNSVLLACSLDGKVEWYKSRSTPQCECYIRSNPGGNLYMGRSAINNVLFNWSPIPAGDYDVSSVSVSAKAFTEPMIDIECTAYEPAGQVSVPNGVLDTGGGGDDALITTFF